MPPYLIGQEAASPIPFSATNQTSLRHCMNYQPEHASEHFEAFPDCPSPRNTQKMTCWEILTVRLGRFALEQMAQGTTPSDEVLQDQARQIFYDNDDPWNQTAADNPDWLTLFKKAHGLLDSSNDAKIIDEDRSQLPAYWTPEDLEKWGDLGLRVPLSFAGNLPAIPPTASDELCNPMELDQGIISGFLSDTQGQEEFDFNQMFTALPESEILPDADLARDLSLMHGLDG
ncbi:MAG: hypothetical protein Q9165_003580 [Trypethelium subeluteriae]